MLNYMDNILNMCVLCPRECGADRLSGETGFCGAGADIKIARSALHYWEEPCISGDRGSGTVFFSHCTLGCVYCQNREISCGGKGYAVTTEELAQQFLRLQTLGANNINLVTPTHYVPGIINALDIAKNDGLNLPVIYNCGGYEKPELIRALRGYVDVYLPDIKYFSDRYAVKYSGAKNYFDIAACAVDEMYRQVGKCVFDDNGIIWKGVIVRHLMLPGLLFEAKKIIDYLYENYGSGIYISLMSQYTRMPGIGKKFPELDKNVPNGHYNALVNYCADLGMENVYIQTEGAADLKYVPDFYGNI